MNKLRISYSILGNPWLIHYNRGSENNPMWATLPFNPSTKNFEPQSELDQILLNEIQALPEWETLDLSDRPPSNDSTVAEPNFAGLAAAVRDTPVFGKAYMASKSNSDILSALSFFMSALNTNVFTIQDLEFALKDLQRALGSIWSQEDSDFINLSLQNNGFGFQI
ncbi:hypothetical protein Glo7428_3156 [Gloeocapsa sp. PCC 7428]|uniref:hypothetical protein n=1 Tax=Gloeocapsa sp. PCC 7428 TaxID=1173026 RepID=UPI0002A5C7E8|nr:hypothetical protein [Gloeocapsa sp. PCC 7428]AFZ31643.1 hypothetical protein Glo7428_3156 [Gloeocapsa sp. PCC 7428]